jgi:hypothetical protein
LQTVTAAEKGVRMELIQLQADNDALQTRLQGLVAQRQQDKQAVSQLERRLNDERKAKQNVENQLLTERKTNKERQKQEAAESAAVARAAQAK